MIDRDHKLPLARQAKAVGISRGSIYYRPRSVGEAGLGLMRRIDELHLEYPFAGSRDDARPAPPGGTLLRGVDTSPH